MTDVVVVGAGPTGLLVRPDGYVAWAGQRPDGLPAALAQCGAAPAVAA